MPVKYRFVGMKAHDDKLKSIIIRKWRFAFFTQDEGIPEIAKRQLHIDQTNRDRQDGVKKNTFESSDLAHAKFSIIFNKKMQNKLPPEIREIAPKYPIDYVLSDVYYVIQDKKMFINFFSEIKKKETRI